MIIAWCFLLAINPIIFVAFYKSKKTWERFDMHTTIAVRPHYTVKGYIWHSILVPNKTFSTVFYLNTTDLQRSRQYDRILLFFEWFRKSPFPIYLLINQIRMKTTSLLFSSVLSNELFWNLGREKFGKKVDDILAVKKDQLSRNILKDLEIEGKNLHQNDTGSNFQFP